MPQPTCGTATRCRAVAGAFVVTRLLGPDPTYPTPVIAHVAIRGDTVWFVGGARDGTPEVAYCHVRSTGAWCRTTPPAGLSAARPTQAERAAGLRPGSAVALGAGWSLDCTPAAADARACGTRRVTGARGLHLSLGAPVRPGAHARQAPFSTSAASWAARGGTAWLGLAGFASEGEAERGGLVALDSATGGLRRVTHRWLDEATVTALTADSTGLWIGTMHHGEYGDYGRSGLVRYEPARGAAARWTRVTAADGSLPGDLVRSVAAQDGIVAVATDGGLAVRGPDGRWTRRYWRLTLSGDSIVHTLAADGPEDPGGPRALRFLFVRDLHVPNPGAVLAGLGRDDAAAGAVPAANPNAGPNDDADAAARALATPALLAPLTDAVRRDARAVDPVVLTAVGLLRARDAASALRALLERPTPEPERAREAAVALARVGDPIGTRWIRARLAAEPAGDAVSFADPRVDAARMAARIRDVGSLPLLASLLARDVLPPGVGEQRAVGPQPLAYETGAGLMTALLAYRTPEARRLAAHVVTTRPLLRAAFLAGLDSAALADPAVRGAGVRRP